MRQTVKDFLNTAPRLVTCGHLYKLSEGYAHEGGDYDAAQRWLAKAGYHYEMRVDAWVKA